MNKFISNGILVTALILASVSPVLAGNYGSSPSNNGNNNGGNNSGGNGSCNNEKPKTPSINSVRRSGANEIEIGWAGVDRGNSWTIAYGKKSGQYTYGISNFGDNGSRSVKIGMLPPGIYYAVIKANNGCTPGEFSQERKITVSAGGSVLGATTTRKVVKGKVLGAKTVAPKANTAPAPVVQQQAAPTVQQPAAPAPVAKQGFFQKIAKFFGM